ncbi:MAG TPA: hypothetical protein VET30_01155 [Pseudoxanthomonas sp.]|nr:hypothetical protein [Pseudoxanthomonas sp.]
MHARHAVVAIASSLLLLLAALPARADQKIKTKSNIKNDRIAATCGDGCNEAGQAWAAESKATSVSDCESTSPSFTEGCKAYLQAQQVPKPVSD